MHAPSNPGIRLMLVDDHPLVRDGLRARLESVPGFHVVAEAADATSALQIATTQRPDLVLMDISLRSADGVNGIQATRQLLQQMPALRVLVLSMLDSPQTMREALHAGASGYLLKDSPAQDIVLAIQRVMAGERLIPAGLDDASPVEPRGLAALTPREREVLGLIAEGLSSKTIGERLDMGVRTVETHRTHLRRKLELPSPAALVRFAVEWRAKP